MTSPANSEPALTSEELLEAANARILELEQALRKEITFRAATDLRGREIWLSVMDLIDIFHKAYQLRNDAVNNNNRWAKLIFTVTNEGRVIDVKLESYQSTEEDES